MGRDYEKITQRFERKLPSILADGEKLGLGRDIEAYRLTQFKRANPQRFNQRKTVITNEIINLKVDVDHWWITRKQR